MIVRVKVPATTANIGPGFDCLGLALNLFNTVEVKLGGNNVDRDHLVYKAVKKVYDSAGKIMPEVEVNVYGDIPIERGLGSSASCIVGGIIAANKLLGNVLSFEQMLNLAVEMEGHPDNVVPAFVGGMTVSVQENGKTYFVKIDVPKSIMFVGLIPEIKLSTKKARAVLPDMITQKDAVFNVSRVAFLISSLMTGKLDNLSFALQDRLHQPYRKTLIPDFDVIFDAARYYGAKGVFLSGAGPTIIAVNDVNNTAFIESIERTVDDLQIKWNVVPLFANTRGAEIIEVR
ncbi:homoserine kinase [Caldanaerobius fijiensis DSM 17918]|uniref:Homoserine kinase n=1 Tax=Caldanaerobius fijiensis DSM 17918 TaxID=1121256 RepID=A0A1M5DL47_9THEO|nr:homoserine kinase [Caldanaerobius fijiensis]SHF67636.1 homoserine kinase [Caldanaerobius fijiensis DSM 17918]